MDAAGHSVLPLQPCELRRREVTPLAGTEALVPDAGERQAREPHHRKSGRLTQPVDLPILSLVQHDLEPGLVTFDTQA